MKKDIREIEEIYCLFKEHLKYIFTYLQNYIK